MTYEEAVELVAKERNVNVEDIRNMSCGEGSTCTGDPCRRIRNLMERPGKRAALVSADVLLELPSGDVVATKRTRAQVLRPPSPEPPPVSNPKTLMGNLKVPNLSVVPFTGIIHEARAMQYGAFHAPRKDRAKPGYDPFNWRDQKIEYLIYAEAAIRHIASAVDREDIDPDTGDLKVSHLGLAKATLGILIDAIEHGTVIDDRSPTACGRVAALLRELRKTS